jgi:hypothetical protein
MENNGLRRPTTEPAEIAPNRSGAGYRLRLDFFDGVKFKK